MSKNRMAPPIRFQGFTEPWEQRKLGEMAESFQYGLNAAAKKYDGKNKYIRITDIDDLSHEFSQSNLTSPDTDISQADNYRLNEGNILFARTGASVGKTYIYKHSDGRVYYAGFLIRAKLFKEYDSEFVFQNTLTSKYKRFIQITSQRSGQPGVNAQEYENYGLMVPSLKEQKGIGNLLANLDNLITLHQHKLEQQKKLKKYFLKNMFPEEGETVPRIRFKGFTGDWEQRKFADLATVRRGLTYKPHNVIEGGKRVLRSSNINENTFQVHNDDVFVDENVVNIPCVNNGDILITSANGSSRLIGKHAIIRDIPENSAVHGGFMLLASSDEPEFVNALMSSLWYTKFINAYVAGGNGAIGNLNKNDLEEQIAYAPQKEEMHKIGDFFENLDHLITIHQRKIDQLQAMKKFMLQNLFV